MISLFVLQNHRTSFPPAASGRGASRGEHGRACPQRVARWLHQNCRAFETLASVCKDDNAGCCCCSCTEMKGCFNSHWQASTAWEQTRFPTHFSPKPEKSQQSKLSCEQARRETIRKSTQISGLANDPFPLAISLSGWPATIWDRAADRFGGLQ